MTERRIPVSDLFRVHERFQRSVQLERDFLDPSALDDYVVTPSMAAAFRRIAEGLQPSSGRRAWRVTGDYGVGKSAFALALAHLLAREREDAAERISATLGWPGMFAGSVPSLTPVLLTGSRTGLVEGVAAGIAAAMSRRRPDRRKVRFQTRVSDLLASIGESGSVSELEELVEIVRDQLWKEGKGLLLVVDELGKHLEFAAQDVDGGDVFVLQRLAELASRSGDRPFVLVGLLHQGFQAYAERLPSATRHEWDKVAGRFDEIVFDQPLTDTAALIGGALNVRTHLLPPEIAQAAATVAHVSSSTGWLGRGDRATDLDAATLYPLHPTLLPLLVRFFSRFGQNERSLFGFLLSSEPFGLQDFSTRRMSPSSWYGLAEFYDYVRTSFGHRLAGGSYRNNWMRIVSTIDGSAETSAQGIRVLKVVALLNLIDAEDLRPTRDALAAALSPTDPERTAAAVTDLLAKGMLFQRGGSAGLRLWPGSSVNLEACLADAARAIGPSTNVAAGLVEHLDAEPILARRHYVETGTMRYFDVRHVAASELLSSSVEPYDGDGLVLVALANTHAERSEAVASALEPTLAGRRDVLVCVGPPLMSLAPELMELRSWEWISANVPELAEDAYAAAEVSRHLASARRALTLRLDASLGLRGRATGQVTLFHAGIEIAARGERGISSMLSSLCEDLYADAPRIANELLNRNVLGSSASAARMRLVEGIFTASEKSLLGLEAGRSPPEKSMYMSFLQRGMIHVETAEGWTIVEPGEVDPLRLKPAFDALARAVAGARGERVSAACLLDLLHAPPFGVRRGVSPLLLAVLLRTRAHEIAVYERGTFLHRFAPSDFLRLVKAPATFDLQHCRIAGVRLDVFHRLADAFASSRTGREPDLLDVVRPLCQFAAQLPEFTRRGAPLGRAAQGVRDALLSAREPSSMLFRDLPIACGLDPVESDVGADETMVQTFVEAFSEAIAELRAAYPELLSRIVARVAEAIGEDRLNFDRARLASRAARVALAARDPRLRTFSSRLRDPGLSDDSWAEALASFIVAKPPSKWGAADEARFDAEVGTLAAHFGRVEAAAFADPGGRVSASAVRLNLTRGDGEDLVRVVEPRHCAELAVRADAVRDNLPTDRGLRLQLLVQLLWDELGGHQGATGAGDVDEVPRVGSVR